MSNCMSNTQPTIPAISALCVVVGIEPLHPLGCKLAGVPPHITDNEWVGGREGESKHSYCHKFQQKPFPLSVLTQACGLLNTASAN